MLFLFDLSSTIISKDNEDWLFETPLFLLIF